MSSTEQLVITVNQLTDDGAGQKDGQDASLMDLFLSIASRDRQEVVRMLERRPDFARDSLVTGATRQAPTDYYVDPIEHHIYDGDTALHVAAAAYDLRIAQTLIELGASVDSRNRRGAQPLHYAVDGNPESRRWDPAAQQLIVKCLLDAGADPNSPNKSGVTPLHRAVRTRCTAAVRTLLETGAQPRLWNGNGSTPLHVAVQNTGRGGSGSPAAREQQREIIMLLLKHGARPSDKNAAGKSVAEYVHSDWIREILESS